MSVFYQKFERHSHGEGLKAQSTHYCAGCGHGLVHKYVADAIEELGIQDETVLVSPVGCSVFAYYYFDVGNTQAAHGRAAAVAIGHKMANPKAVVISYQGDGDLASIGLAETVNAAQLGLPITVVFINNATYGMTGGQMAPTTLMGQVSATSPFGRGRMNGEPMKMAELIASLDGPVYVERVGLYWPAGRLKAARAIKKAIRMQKEGKGYAFIEVLAECPTMLKLTPDKAEQWVKENMVPIFPLGVKKDLTEKAEPWFDLPASKFESDPFLHAVDATTDAPKRFCTGFPAHLDPTDISMKLAGAGGDGAQTAAMLVAIGAINEGFDGTHIPSYGPESRGGTSYADVHVAQDEVLNPASPNPHVLIAFNAPSLAKFGLAVKKGGFIVYDSSVAKEVKAGPGVTVVGVPFTEIAQGLGKLVVKNVVALGALQAATNLFPRETFLSAIREALKDKPKLIPLNEQAFDAGMKAAREAMAARN